MPATTAIDPFLEHLQDFLQIDEAQLPRPGEWANAGNTLGMLALRLDATTLEQVDEILELQEQLEGDEELDFQQRRERGLLFGQLAVRLGFLTEKQVHCLLDIQRINRCLELGAKLVLEETCDTRALVMCLAEFYDR